MAAPLSGCVLSPGADSLLGEKSPLFKNTVVFVPVEKETEAHYLSACINSCCSDLVARSYSVGKSFGSPHLLQQVKIAQFKEDQPAHLHLAELSRRAHDLVAKLVERPDDNDAKRKLAETEDAVDRATAKLWGLTDAELAEIRKALELFR